MATISSATFPIATDNDFKDAFNLVLQFEGGYSNDKGDKGGETNLGVTKDTYNEYRSSRNLPLQSVKLLTLQEASDIYKHGYWLKAACNAMPRRTAIAVFDWQVNSGQGATTLQEVLGVEVDGSVGQRTLSEFSYWLSKKKGEFKLLSNYFKLREYYYYKWAVGDQAQFLSDWLSRCNALKKYLMID